MMEKDNAVEIRNVSKTFKTKSDRNPNSSGFFKRSGKVSNKVIDNVSFNVKKGEVFGIIGGNGSGKSTLLKMISKIIKPDTGTIDIDGSVASVLELNMGFEKELSGIENIYIKGSMFGLSRAQIDERMENIIEYAELGDYIDLPLRVYSSGMTGRLAFAIMVNVDADILVSDEALSTGDIAFGSKSGAFLTNLKKKGKTVVLVTHSISMVRELCDRVAWIDKGAIREIGSTNSVCGHYETEMTESYEIIKELAKSGSPPSQNSLGCMYRDGNNVVKDHEEAKKWFRKAANLGNDEGKINLADMLISEGRPEDKEEALALYMSAARRGNRNARIKMSRLITQDESDLAEEVKNDFKKLLASEDQRIYYEYADLIMKITWNNEERSEALGWFEKSAESGNVYAMYRIALMYRDGTGPKRDTAKFMEWLKKAGENGHVRSQIMLGDLYRDGVRVECDEPEAFRWYMMAAEANDADAQYQIATMYNEGIGTEQNEEESKRWLKRYFETGLAREMGILADSFAHGKYSVYDPKIGMRWYSAYENLNGIDSTYNRAILLMNEKNLDDNVSEIIRLLSSSAKRGSLNSAIVLSDFYKLEIIDHETFSPALKIIMDNSATGNIKATNSLESIFFNSRREEIDRTRVMQDLRKIALSGNTTASNKLGIMYRDGILVNQDLDEARRWFEMGTRAGNVSAANALLGMCRLGVAKKESLDTALAGLKDLGRSGNIIALRTMGNLYSEGKTVGMNLEKSFEMYERAAKLGDVVSKNILGNRYLAGKGVPKDAAQALKCFISAAEQGHVHSVLAIIKMYDADQADDASLEYALRRLEQLANGGSVTAIRTLGTIHLEGKSVPKDVDRAIEWFRKSANLGDVHSRNKLKALEQNNI